MASKNPGRGFGCTIAKGFLAVASLRGRSGNSFILRVGIGAAIAAVVVVVVVLAVVVVVVALAAVVVVVLAAVPYRDDPILMSEAV
jgi:hypothetical protein